ncbi:MAG: UDP-2,3-diacylglucosamine diphosphatase [Verrucomicrobiota bacterium]
MHNDTEYIIISDVHLGSRYCLHELFLHFLDDLPEKATLILNGDTVDDPDKELPAEHRIILKRLRDESCRRRIIWLQGNHDDQYIPTDPAKIEFIPDFSIGKRLYVSHGFDFDNIMPRNRHFIMAFRLFHRFRMKLGASPVHVARYAKKWSALYKILRRHVVSNAIEHAAENGFEAVTCGHTHFAEDLKIRGIRYINTGAWTEKPVYYLHVDRKKMTLCQYKG